MTDKIDLKTQETAKRLFGGGIKMDPPYRMWKAFDRELANDFSRFITGNLYSRTVLTAQERQMVAGELARFVTLVIGTDAAKHLEVIVGLADAADENEGGGVRLLQEVLEFLGAVVGVDGHQYRSPHRPAGPRPPRPQ